MKITISKTTITVALIGSLILNIYQMGKLTLAWNNIECMSYQQNQTENQMRQKLVQSKLARIQLPPIPSTNSPTQ